ncbi:MAG: hypothetical protein Q9181_000321 [Wetmoreana brouardii]
MHYGGHPPERLIEIIAVHIELAGQDEMGPVKGGYLDVIGRLSQIDPQEGAWQDRKVQRLLIKGVPRDLDLVKDDPQTKIDGQLYCMILLMTDEYDYTEFSGLALQQLGSSNVYQRIGSVGFPHRYDLLREDPILRLLGDFRTGDDGKRKKRTYPEGKQLEFLRYTAYI